MSNPYAELESIFHEPNRLAIMSALAAHPTGLSFVELKSDCKLTDGNLSRHLSALEKGGAVKIKKSFVDSKPRTTVMLSEGGRKSFLRYLEALEDVLATAAERVKESAPASKIGLGVRTAKQSG